MENSRLREAASTAVNVTVGKRGREYLTDREVERLIEAAKQNRSGHRDATAILVAYRHGLRASELVALRRDDIERRESSGQSSKQPPPERSTGRLPAWSWSCSASRLVALFSKRVISQHSPQSAAPRPS